jgi:hypothetical protein
MNILVFIFALEAGIVPHDSFLMYERQAQVYEYNGGYYYPTKVSFTDNGPIFYTDLQAEVELLGFIFFGGGIRVQMQQAGAWNFDPNALFYEFRAGLRWKGIELHVLRACRHPQMTYAFNYQAVSGWEGAYLEIGVKVSGRLPLIKQIQPRRP